MDVGGGLREVARQTVARFLRLGEEAKFAVRGRPAPEDAIVVAAAARSGSTWLADMLSAAPGLQEIFEPFHPQHSALYRQLVGVQANQSRQYKRVYLRSGTQHPQWDVLLAQALTGKIRSYRTDYQRRRFLPDRYVVKFIRANMMLGYLADRFQPQIVFLTRHPCAVVYSRLHRVREPWFADVKDLLADEALVADYLQPWLRYVEQE
ncbi:MAG: sulfotransferase, partial [Chloroflexi bacterium]|nr:sulfotransferase [Chloroflexota bacterium]